MMVAGLLLQNLAARPSADWADLIKPRPCPVRLVSQSVVVDRPQMTGWHLMPVSGVETFTDQPRRLQRLYGLIGRAYWLMLDHYSALITMKSIGQGKSLSCLNSALGFATIECKILHCTKPWELVNKMRGTELVELDILCSHGWSESWPRNPGDRVEKIFCH